MKVPIRWLKDYVDFDLSLEALVNRLALAGLEVSGIKHWGTEAPEGLRLGNEEPYPVWDKDKIIIGLVTKVDRPERASKGRQVGGIVDLLVAQQLCPRTVRRVGEVVCGALSLAMPARRRL